MNNFLTPQVPSWVNPTGMQQIRPNFNNMPDVAVQQPSPVQPKQNIMENLPEPIQKFIQMLSGGDLSSLKGFQGLRPVDHDPFNGVNPFKNIGSNINKWGTEDTGLGVYGG